MDSTFSNGHDRESKAVESWYGEYGSAVAQILASSPRTKVKAINARLGLTETDSTCVRMRQVIELLISRGGHSVVSDSKGFGLARSLEEAQAYQTQCESRANQIEQRGRHVVANYKWSA